MTRISADMPQLYKEDSDAGNCELCSAKIHLDEDVAYDEASMMIVHADCAEDRTITLQELTA